MNDKFLLLKIIKNSHFNIELEDIKEKANLFNIDDVERKLLELELDEYIGNVRDSYFCYTKGSITSNKISL